MFSKLKDEAKMLMITILDSAATLDQKAMKSGSLI